MASLSFFLFFFLSFFLFHSFSLFHSFFLSFILSLSFFLFLSSPSQFRFLFPSFLFLFLSTISFLVGELRHEGEEGRRRKKIVTKMEREKRKKERKNFVCSRLSLIRTNEAASISENASDFECNKQGR